MLKCVPTQTGYSVLVDDVLRGVIERFPVTETLTVHVFKPWTTTQMMTADFCKVMAKKLNDLDARMEFEKNEPG